MSEGEIVQIGTGKIQEDGSVRPLDVKVGDKILFGKFSGTDVKLEGEELLILHEGDIFGRLENGVFKPLGDRVIIKRIEARGITDGGIIIPDIAKEKMSEGEIVQIGTGKIQEDGSIRPLDVKIGIGAKILFSKFAGTDVKLAGEDLLILHEEDIFGVLANAS